MSASGGGEFIGVKDGGPRTTIVFIGGRLEDNKKARATQKPVQHGHETKQRQQKSAGIKSLASTLFISPAAELHDHSLRYGHEPWPCCACSLMGVLLLACLGILIFVLCLLFGMGHRWIRTTRSSLLRLDLFKVLYHYCQLIHCFFKHSQ